MTTSSFLLCFLAMKSYLYLLKKESVNKTAIYKEITEFEIFEFSAAFILMRIHRLLSYRDHWCASKFLGSPVNKII